MYQKESKSNEAKCLKHTIKKQCKQVQTIRTNKELRKREKNCIN